MAKKSSGRGIGLDATQPVTPRKAQLREEQRYRAEDDLRTLRNAEKVRADPARVKMAQTVAREEMRALQRVTGKKT